MCPHELLEIIRAQPLRIEHLLQSNRERETRTQSTREPIASSRSASRVESSRTASNVGWSILVGSDLTDGAEDALSKA